MVSLTFFAFYDTLAFLGYLLYWGMYFCELLKGPFLNSTMYAVYE